MPSTRPASLTIADDTPAVERTEYRDAMARLAAAVNVITSIGDTGVCGFTASAVCSVTDTPPTLLVCVNRSTQSYPVIVQSGVLCVNTIAERQEALANAFAGGVKDMTTRFEGASWSTAVTGSPVLDGAAAAFDCRIIKTTTVGTHDVFICEVMAVKHNVDNGSLVYVDRKFHRLS